MNYSIITPVYNRADCIARCLDSVIRNLADEVSIEHIVVDDGSTDNTPRIVADYASRYSHIRFIAFDENRGTNAARNAAIQVATGEYCVILDSDDYFLDDAITIIEQYLKENPQYSYYLFAPDDMCIQYNNNKLLCHDCCLLSYEDFLVGKVSGDFVHVIKSVIAKKYLFNEEVRIHELLTLLFYYKEAKNIFFFNKVVTIRERNRQDSVTRDCLRTSQKHINKCIKASELYLEWFGEDLTRIGANNFINRKKLYLLDNYLISSDYKSSKDIIEYLSINKVSFPLVYKIIYYFRLGFVYKLALLLFLFVKYKLFKKSIQ